MGEQEKIGGQAYGNGMKLLNKYYVVKVYYDKNDILQFFTGLN